MIAACGGESVTAPESTTTSTDTSMAADDHTEFSFGDPADASGADRVIDVTAGDDFRFEPAEITVTTGEVITFRVTNSGAIPHDFTLDDGATQGGARRRDGRDAGDGDAG